MKMETKRWLARILFVALVATGTLVLGPRIAAARDCVYPSAGTCPPLTPWPDTGPGSCYQACQLAGWPNGGSCVGSCCVCFE